MRERRSSRPLANPTRVERPSAISDDDLQAESRVNRGNPAHRVCPHAPSQRAPLHNNTVPQHTSLPKSHRQNPHRSNAAQYWKPAGYKDMDRETSGCVDHAKVRDPASSAHPGRRLEFVPDYAKGYWGRGEERECVML